MIEEEEKAGSCGNDPEAKPRQRNFSLPEEEKNRKDSDGGEVHEYVEGHFPMRRLENDVPERMKER
ncbi:MAG: hypothetical protein GTO08_08055 [Deltaproteobacteria bacterium]|nr:hypothetical protein [Deltaproteobacteria bacterium]